MSAEGQFFRLRKCHADALTAAMNEDGRAARVWVSLLFCSPDAPFGDRPFPMSICRMAGMYGRNVAPSAVKKVLLCLERHGLVRCTWKKCTGRDELSTVALVSDSHGLTSAVRLPQSEVRLPQSEVRLPQSDCQTTTVRLPRSDSQTPTVPQSDSHGLKVRSPQSDSLHTVETIESVESVEAKTVPRRQSPEDSPKKVTKPVVMGWVATIAEAAGRDPDGIFAEIKERAYGLFGKQVHQLTEPEAKRCAVVASRVYRVADRVSL